MNTVPGSPRDPCDIGIFDETYTSLTAQDSLSLYGLPWDEATRLMEPSPDLDPTLSNSIELNQHADPSRAVHSMIDLLNDCDYDQWGDYGIQPDLGQTPSVFQSPEAPTVSPTQLQLTESHSSALVYEGLQPTETLVTSSMSRDFLQSSWSGSEDQPSRRESPSTQSTRRTRSRHRE
jgi:hypothetical protein